MLVKDLSGAELDKWVALSLGYKVRAYSVKAPDMPDGWFVIDDGDVIATVGVPAAINSISWSTEWRAGGPLIEKYEIFLEPLGDENDKCCGWKAGAALMFFDGELVSDGPIEMGDTPLIAAMRCIVSAKFGDEANE